MNERLKSLRKILKMSQKEFAEKINSRQTTIAGYESGFHMPSPAIIKSICREFNVREAWLRDGTGEMLEQLTEDEDRARFFGGLSKESASPEVLAFIDALRKTPEPAIRAALEFVCNVYESYNALQKEKENGD